MTDRLTDDEIKALRELRRLASFLPWATGVEFDKPDACGQEGCIHARDGVAVLEVTRGGFSNDAAYAVAACNAIDRMLDEIEERRRAERSVIIDEHCPPIDPKTLAKAVARLAKFNERKDGDA